MAPDAATLAKALRAMPSRDAQVVLSAMTGREPLTELYGVEEAEAGVLLYRAAIALQAELERRPPPVAPFELERRAARALVTSLGAPGQPEAPADALLALKAHGDEVRALLAKAEAADAVSPARRRETQLRWLAIAIILALTAFFYWREAHKPLPPPQPRPTLPRK